MSTQLPLTSSGHPSIPFSVQRSAYQRFLKRAIDVLGSATLLCLLCPLLLFIALLIAVTDGFPIIYLRRVVGVNQSFDAYKFRTMCRNADAMLQASPELQEAFTHNFKLRSDPRITRVGSWLRRYSLDELPQLMNVLRGQMSLVGPRMISAPELSKYGEYQSVLISVQPGLTGYWQTRGRQDVSYGERVQMDMHYITHWTLGLDLNILLRTPWTVIKGKGAY
jgi:lipopolysaccharide/colanic/teichoic acid biosynthesis glycosyltransferase